MLILTLDFLLCFFFFLHLDLHLDFPQLFPGNLVKLFLLALAVFFLL